MATMKTLNGYGFNATELNGKTSDSYLQLGDDGTGSTGEAPTINAGTFGGMTVSQFVDMIYPVGSIYMSASGHVAFGECTLASLGAISSCRFSNLWLPGTFAGIS